MDYGLIVDLETTGIDSEKDKIIEIGLLEFAVSEFERPTITGMYSGLEDPGQPLRPEIKKLTGLSDQVLAGKKIEWDTVRQYFDKASVVIAHNMPFDRGFLLKRPELKLEATHWACSIRHIDWDGKGFRSKALNYLAADSGFVNPFAHRALFDCATTFRLIGDHFQELIQSSYLAEYRVLARGAPYEAKDKLREHAYYWDPIGRVWHKTILEDRLPLEREFLAKEVYQGAAKHEEVRLS